MNNINFIIEEEDEFIVENKDNNEFIKDLFNKMNEFSNEAKNKIIHQYEMSNQDEKQLLKQNYCFLKNKNKNKPMLLYEKIKLCENLLSQDEKYKIISEINKKNRPILKHVQAKKTEIANKYICQSLLAGNVVMAATKNTISANTQWGLRLVGDLEKKNILKNSKEEIVLLTSTQNTLNDKVTHVSSLDKLLRLLSSKDSKIKLIMICCNSIRINDIIEILESNYNKLKKNNYDLYYDEAHNIKNGIITFMPCIEEILSNQFVVNFTLMSASCENLLDLNSDNKIIKKYYNKNTENNYLWIKHILEKNAIDYTQICNLNSDSQNYSSFKEAIQITFEELQDHNEYNKYDDDVSFNLELFKSCYTKITDPDIIKTRLEFDHCPFLKNEKEALIIGKNLLDNFYTYENEKIILEDKFTLHIMNTPCRIILTVTLIHHALTQSYNPVCIGFYNLDTDNKEELDSVHIWFNPNGQIKCINYKKDIMLHKNKKERNEQINDIIIFMKDKYNITDRPYICFGNEEHTGESLTYVNYKYDTVRSCTMLPSSSTSNSKSPQVFGRLNYTTDKFVEVDPNFKKPIKFMVGYKKDIDNAIQNEENNDLHVQLLESRTNNDNVQNEENITISFDKKDKREEDGSIIAIPVKIEINEETDIRIIEMKDILKKDKRNKKERNRILEIINDCYHDNTIDITDKSEKFVNKNSRQINTIFKLTGVRAYKNGHKINAYNIESYSSYHNTSIPYTNDKQSMKGKNTCQLEVSIDRYIKNNNNEEPFKNFFRTMWLGYKY